MNTTASSMPCGDPTSNYFQTKYCGLCGVSYIGTFHTCQPTTYPVTYYPTTTWVVQQDPALIAELKELIDVLKHIADKLDIIDNKE